MVFDSRRRRVVLFGGNDGGLRNDVWSLSLDASPAWTELQAIGPPPQGRLLACAVYDGPRDRMIVFGGSGPEELNDVWALSFEGTPTWSRVETSGVPPSPRYGHAAVIDPVGDRMIVFGGSSGGDETWALGLGNAGWNQFSFTGSTPGQVPDDCSL